MLPRMWSQLPCMNMAVNQIWLTSGFIRMKPPSVAIASMKSARSARETRGPLSRPIGPACERPVCGPSVKTIGPRTIVQARPLSSITRACLR